MRLLPGSLSKLLVIGYAVIIVPLALALSVNFAGFNRLAERSQQSIQRSNAGDRVAHELTALRDEAVRSRDIAFWQVFLLIPFSIFAAIFFARQVVGPIRQVDGAIRRMGSGEFTVPVSVDGPPDLQLLGRRIEWLRHRLFELEQQKMRFLRQVSHELKTPLTALREGSELLADEVLGKLTPEQQEVAGILRSSSVALQRMIEDLLSYGAAGFQRTQLRCEPVEALRVVARVLDDQNLALRARALRIFPKVEDVTVEADPEKLRVMLDNLLSNAVKFAPERSAVEIVVRASAHHFVLEVADAGPGVPPSERERIFEPFYRGRNAAGGGLPGSGIGLSIVRDFAHAHGGTAQVVDEPGRTGARLRITLPLRRKGVI